MLKNKIPVLSLAFGVLAVMISSSALSQQKTATPTVTPTDEEWEAQIATMMKQAKDQKRRSLTFNPTLARIARERAYDMARRGYFDHTNPDGIGPNYILTKAGFVLGKGYSKGKSANSVESIACGGTAADAWSDWMSSKGHRTHILGLNSFYAEQTEYGVGHAYMANSPYGHYWVVITVKPNTGGNVSQGK